MAKYMIAGNSKTVEKFIKERPKEYFREKNGEKIKVTIGEKLINCRTKKIIYTIGANDTIILLAGWWGRSWAKEAIKDVMAHYPQMKFEYHDGKFGESERKTLKSDTIKGRYQILDFSQPKLER